MRDIAAASARLRPFMSEPTTLNAVLAFMRAAPGPVFMKEVAEGIDMPRFHVDRAMRRLVKKGALTRYKIPAQRHGYSKPRREILPGIARHNLWLYSLADRHQ